MIEDTILASLNTANMKHSQLMKQYADIKSKYPNAIVLFRVNNYYEIISNDAVAASNVLDITLTKREEYEMAGFAYESLDKYLRLLIKAGHTVAIVDNDIN